MFKKVGSPAYTGGYFEQHLKSDYTSYVESSSLLLPGKTIETSVFHCPRCKVEMPEPEHGIACRCGGCGLNIQAYGNSLYIWPDRERKE